MFCPSAAIAIPFQNGITTTHSVTIGPREKQIMTREKKEQDPQKDLQEAAFLRDVIKRSQEGDVQAMGAIYERFNRPVFNLVYRHTYDVQVAEDLLQDIFLKIFAHLHSLKNEETFVGWLYRIAINTCYSYFRQKKSRVQGTIPLSQIEETVGEGDPEFGDKIMKTSLDDAIHNLPDKLRTVFILHDVQGFKHKEIAGVLGCTVGTSKSQLFKARMKIRAFFKKREIT